MNEKPISGAKFLVIDTGDFVYFERINVAGRYLCRTTERKQIDAEYEVFHPSQLKLINKARKPLNKVSTGQKQRNRVYTTLRKIFLENHKICEAKLSGCRCAASEVHHKAGRIGSNFLNVKTWLAVCESCHKWIEANPDEAKKNNLSVNRL